MTAAAATGKAMDRADDPDDRVDRVDPGPVAAAGPAGPPRWRVKNCWSVVAWALVVEIRSWQSVQLGALGLDACGLG